jgi:hypothetical protein
MTDETAVLGRIAMWIGPLTEEEMIWAADRP